MRSVEPLDHPVPAIPAARADLLRQLSERCSLLADSGTATHHDAGAASTHWSGDEIPALQRGATHELFCGEVVSNDHDWLPPLSILAHLARQTLAEATHNAAATGHILWIGRRCFPFPRSLVTAPNTITAPATPNAGRDLLNRSLFIDTPGHAEQVWAIDLALRCPAVSVVVADGSHTRMAESRRFQLAAAAGGALCLLARPSWERRELSAAMTRWIVTPTTNDHEPGWHVELLRRKGPRPLVEGARRWAVRRAHETGDVRVVAAVPDRPLAAPLAPERRSA